MEDNKTKTVEIEASGSSEEEGLVLTTTNTPSPPTVEDSNVLQVEAFLPVVNVFVRGGPNPLEKRSAIDTNEQNKTDIDINKGEDVVPDTVSVAEDEDRDESSGANCRLLEHKIDLPALDPDVLQPDIVDVGKCSNSTDTVECKPTAFKNLMVLLKRTGEIEVSSIEIRENYIITECTPIAKTQPSVDEFTSSGLNPLRKRRFVDTSKTKSTQKMREDKDEITSSSASETATELDHEDSTTVVSNCTLLENKIRLSTINQNILVPEIVDFGKCSGSTDVVECRPTGFQNLFVLLKMNDGTISFNSLPNAITTECTPYFNTPTV